LLLLNESSNVVSFSLSKKSQQYINQKIYHTVNTSN